jgi:hypothetical protein
MVEQRVSDGYKIMMQLPDTPSSDAGRTPSLQHGLAAELRHEGPDSHSPFIGSRETTTADRGGTTA